MINIQKMTPTVYYNNSRDFQVLGRAFEIIANYVLMNIDTMKNNPITENMDDSLVELALYTVGFHYSTKDTSVDLKKLAQVFKYLLSFKGTSEAISQVVSLLLKSIGVKDDFEIKINNMTGAIRDRNITEDIYTIEISIPRATIDIRILDNLFEYILPAGYLYSITEIDTRTKVYDNDVEAVNTIPFKVSELTSDDFFGQIADIPTLSDDAATRNDDINESDGKMSTSMIVGFEDIA